MVGDFLEDSSRLNPAVTDHPDLLAQFTKHRRLWILTLAAPAARQSPAACIT